MDRVRSLNQFGLLKVNREDIFLSKHVQAPYAHVSSVFCQVRRFLTVNINAAGYK